MSKSFAARLLKSRFQQTKDLRNVFEAQKSAERRRRRLHPTPVAKGVHNGQFFRVRDPGPAPPARMPKLHNPSNPPVKPFVQPPPLVATAGGASSTTTTIQEFREASRAEQQELFRDYWERIKLWWKANFAVVVLNLGSVFSLIGFTRSDVLELRFLSMTGSLSYVVYFLALPGPRDWTPIAWSMTFIAVNGQKIYEILVERNSTVHLAQEHKRVYEQFFAPHGVTTKQFEYIIRKAETIQLKKGDVFLREGEQMKKVYLVTTGQTRAHHLGRRLTAASFTPEAKVEQKGGHSGAWVGEMAFIEKNWHSNTSESATGASQTVGSNDTATPATRKTGRPHATDRAMYTIVCLEDDTTVLAWSHEDMQALLDKSDDMRAALMRAMTAAIVGKVINFTASRVGAPSNWTWISSLWQGSSPKPATIETASAPLKIEVGHKPEFVVPEEEKKKE
jgi:CRP-like cAMP-binding protein